MLKEDQDTFPVQGGGIMLLEIIVHLAVGGFSGGKEEKEVYLILLGTDTWKMIADQNTPWLPSQKRKKIQVLLSLATDKIAEGFLEVTAFRMMESLKC